MQRTTLPVLLFAVSCSVPAIGVEPRYGPVYVGGDVGISTSGASADNPVEDVGIDDDDGTGSLRGDFDWTASHLTVTLQRSAHDGSGTLSADLTAGETTIPAGTAVETDFDLGLHTAYLTFDVLEGSPELGFGLGLAVVDLDFETMDTGGAQSVAFDETLPVPFLAVRGSADVWRVDLEALVGFLAISALDEDYSFLDLDLNGRLRLFGGGGRMTGALALGVRLTALDVEFDSGSDGVALDATFTGPYLGLHVDF